MPSELLLPVGLPHYLAVSVVLFALGFTGVLVRRNILVILMCIELMLNAVNLSFIAFGKFNRNFDGQTLVFFIITVAAAEAGVGLALAVAIFKRFK